MNSFARDTAEPRGVRSRTGSSLRYCLCAALTSAAVSPVTAYDLYDRHGLSAKGEVNTRLGLRYGTNLNYGFGAIDSPDDKDRIDLETAIKPLLSLKYTLPASELYGAVSVVAATTQVDGELSGQFGRSGDSDIDTDAAHVGWRNRYLDFSVGAQDFTIGDGFVVGDGNFNKGGENGEYWIGAYSAWRNTAILRLNTSPIRADAFWLRTDDDLGDDRVVGFNIENSSVERFGRLGLMYFEIIGDRDIGLAGMRVAGVRGADLHLPAHPDFKLYGEFVYEFGKSELTGVQNDAQAWYIEANYQFSSTKWTPKLYYRYSWFSGDRAGTVDNEEYRGLFFTIFKRDWDTWYQGEVTGEFHLFNENQISQMAKLKVFPTKQTAFGFWYYHHELQEPQYFGAPVRSTAWANEVNFAFEYTPNERFYGFAAIAWATPGAGAQQFFGDDQNQLVLETYLSYTFK